MAKKLHMNVQIEKLKVLTEPLRQQIVNHKVYSVINTLEDLRVFMEYHVYAVWDFMSLLKSLQNNLTCTTVPWFPKGTADTRYLINEIVAGEEADLDPDGNRKSHFEIYLDAMTQCGANTKEVTTFIESLQRNGDFQTAFEKAGTPAAAADFVGFTFEMINSKKDYLQSAVFTFGREDLIPGMFISIIGDIHKNFPGSVDIFKYYLERHIEVDGDHHSHLALQMTANLCGNNEQFWKEAGNATLASLQQRINLWDAVYKKITEPRSMNKFDILQELNA